MAEVEGSVTRSADMPGWHDSGEGKSLRPHTITLSPNKQSYYTKPEGLEQFCEPNLCDNRSNDLERRPGREPSSKTVTRSADMPRRQNHGEGKSLQSKLYQSRCFSRKHISPNINHSSLNHCLLLDEFPYT